jgi:L-fuculose-phosphate aldolase
MTQDILKLKKEITKYSRLVYDRSLVGAAGGNISARYEENYLITAGGVSLRDMSPAKVILVNRDGKVLDNSGLRPSKETGMHIRIYMTRPDIDCVIHVHPMYATGISVTGETVPMLTASSALKLKEVPLVRYADPGSEQLAALVEEMAASSSRSVKALLLEKHGLLAFDSGLSHAFDIAELVEETARIAFVAGNYRYLSRT